MKCLPLALLPAALTLAAALAAQARQPRGLELAAVLHLDPPATGPLQPRLRLPPRSFALSGDGRWVVALRTDSRLLFHDLSTGAQRTVDLDPTKTVHALVSCTGCVDVIVVVGNTVQFWNPSLGLPVREVELPVNTQMVPMCINLGPDGRSFWTGKGLFDLMHPEQAPRLRSMGLLEVCFSPRGEELLTSTMPMQSIIGTARGRHVLRLRPLDSQEEEAAAEPRPRVFGGRIVSPAIDEPGADGSIYTQSTDYSFLADGRSLLVCNHRLLQLWDTTPLGPRKSLSIPAHFARAIDDHTVVVAWQEGDKEGSRHLGLWDLRTEQCLWRTPCDAAVGLHVARGGRHVVVEFSTVLQVCRVLR